MTTMHAINSCIVKSSKLTVVATVYRGVVGGVLPESFWQPNEHGVKGGIEPAFLSTTYDRQVAMSYASAPGKAGLVFEMKMGMVDRGAELSWLSQYPHERECLFPPLTGLEVQYTRVEETVLVVGVRTSVNLNSLTIEQVIGKRQRLLIDMARSMSLEVSDELRRSPEWQPYDAEIRLRAAWTEMQVERHLATEHPAGWFNDDNNFSEVMRVALGVKQRMITKGRPASLLAGLPTQLRELPWVGECPPHFGVGGEAAMEYLRLFGHAQGSASKPQRPRIMVSGHVKNFLQLGAHTIVKTTTRSERAAYESLVDTDVECWFPRLRHAVNGTSAVAAEEGSSMLFLQDLTAGMLAPCVMDIKMGTRVVTETLLQAKAAGKGRADLYKKALASPALVAELTAEEHREAALTKTRYMLLREKTSTSATFGFRFDGVHIDGEGGDAAGIRQQRLRSATSREECDKILAEFLQPRPVVRVAFAAQIRDLTAALERSEWFLSHTVVMSSLLLVYDSHPASDLHPIVRIIDLPHCVKLAEGDVITHRRPYEHGNHEEGFLIGLDNLLNVFAASG